MSSFTVEEASYWSDWWRRNPKRKYFMETESGAEFISPAHVRHVMRYAKACRFLKPGMMVIDAACGTGYGISIIAKMVKAREDANLAKIKVKWLEMRHREEQSAEASARAESRL